ncbi:hypothetical protein XENTR_v10017493, partial [Xenopus tropicalis]
MGSRRLSGTVRLILLLLPLGFLPCLTQLVKVTQDQGFLLVPERGSVRLNCTHSGSGFYAMSWYQQKPGRGLTLMVHSADTKPGDMEEGFKDWTMERPDTQNSHLKLSQSGAQHSARYFCAVS